MRDGGGGAGGWGGHISEIINRANSLAAAVFFFFCFPRVLRALFVAWEAVWTRGEFLTGGGGDGKIISVAEAQGTGRKEEGRGNQKKKNKTKEKRTKKSFLCISRRSETNAARASTSPPIPHQKKTMLIKARKHLETPRRRRLFVFPPAIAALQIKAATAGST